MCLRRLRAVPAGQRVEIGIADRADRRAHQWHVAAAIPIVPECAAQIVQLLAGQIRHAGHAGVTGLAMASRAQAQPAWLGRGRALGNGWNGGGQAQHRGQ